jgi:cullin-associated NEDD8-dissociated protein 1
MSMDAIFEKIASKDKDYRYMATSDLLNELQKDTFHVDADTEKRICQVRPHFQIN